MSKKLPATGRKCGRQVRASPERICLDKKRPFRRNGRPELRCARCASATWVENGTGFLVPLRSVATRKAPQGKGAHPFVPPSLGLWRKGRTSLPRLATRSNDTTPCCAGTCWAWEGSLPRCHALQGWQRGPDRPGQTAPEQRACPGRFPVRRARKEGTRFLLPTRSVRTRNLPKEKTNTRWPGLVL
jgi:hypothetical protein